MTWCEAATKLATFVDLLDDWDGQGAVAPSPPIIIVAGGLLIKLRKTIYVSSPKSVSAGPMGGILFVWQEPGMYREAEVTPTGEVEWMRERRGLVEHGAGSQYDKIEWATTEKG